MKIFSQKFTHQSFTFSGNNKFLKNVQIVSKKIQNIINTFDFFPVLRFSVVFISMCLTSAAVKRRPGKGKFTECENFELQNDFDITRYLGLWYEIMSYPFCVTPKAKCVISTYAFSKSGQNISIYSKFVNSLGFANRVIGIAAQESPGRIAVMFPATRKQKVWKLNFLITFLLFQLSRLHFITS